MRVESLEGSASGNTVLDLSKLEGTVVSSISSATSSRKLELERIW